ncbi:MAG: DUF1679 domain-containing protein [Pseudobacteriovorax sp.]|nr:DUF1679 domain-containing protein [Pseudobacteriovorax sp.]
MKAKDARTRENLQDLWNGYGSIIRVDLKDAAIPSVIIKLISLEAQASHPHGWSSQHAHKRKIKSYEVESHWYETHSSLYPSLCRIPHCYGVINTESHRVIVLEDLSLAGFDLLKSEPTERDVKACVNWLAAFHAHGLSKKPKGLWQTGTYWHLETRPDEWQALAAGTLRDMAASIDLALKRCPWQTIVHGDAKIANFCFSTNLPTVAAVDFQYVGGGSGMKDLAYFMSSCLTAEACFAKESSLLEHYFTQLHSGLSQRGFGDCFQEIEEQWRRLYPLAWADFYRFVKGWKPNHWKLHAYSEHMTETAMDLIKSGVFDC